MRYISKPLRLCWRACTRHAVAGRKRLVSDGAGAIRCRDGVFVGLGLKIAWDGASVEHVTQHATRRRSTIFASHVMRFNAGSPPTKFRDIARAMGVLKVEVEVLRARNAAVKPYLR